MGAPPEGETRGGTEGPRQPWGASVVIPPAGPGRQGRWARRAGGGTGRGGAGPGVGPPRRAGPEPGHKILKWEEKKKGGVFVVP